MKIALVLGSGGARGYAHIGVINELLARGHEIVGVAGTSMGALVGGLYAAGKLPDFEEWARALTHRAVIGLMDPAFNGPGMIKAERVVGEVSKILDGAVIEELPIPYTAVASDITNKREVWFQQGPVDMAVRASIAIPSFITPVMLNGRILVDGGLMNPVPLEPVSSIIADATIAVTLSGRPPFTMAAAPILDSSLEDDSVDWLDRFRKGAAGVLDNELIHSLVRRFTPSHEPDSQGEATEAVGEEAERRGFDPVPPDVRLMDIINLSLEAMQGTIERFRMAANPPSILISVPGTACGTLDFHRAADVIAIGQELTAQALDAAEM